MHIEEVREFLPAQLFKAISERIVELRPPQAQAVKKDLLKGKDLIIASPTASGKTLVAEMALVKNILEGKGKGIYIVPLKSLASEKYKEFKEKYGKLGINVAISVGDFDSSDNWLQKYDIIITTSEKLDSLIRHETPWIKEVGTVVIDECHMINDMSRGPTLEILITILKKLIPKAQYIYLSATISNIDELGEWLKADVVKSDYRPVELKEGVVLDDEIYFEKTKDKMSSSRDSDEGLIEDTLKKNKQILIFVSSRRNTEGFAKKAAGWVGKFLSEEEKEELKDVSEKIENTLELPTHQCRKLAEFVKNGVAFHHAGLVAAQKSLIEEKFRAGLIKVVVATTTLAMGVNLPAYRVLMRELRRYTSEGYNWIPVIEYKQMTGRAGRPDYDSFGEALSLSKSEDEKDLIFDKYVFGKTERIYSKLGVEPVLRTYTLSLIASSFCRSRESLEAFFSRTLYAHQYGNIDTIRFKLSKMVENLKKQGFIEEVNGNLIPTRLGLRISQLYLDPETGYYLINILKKADSLNPLGVLHTACRTYEIPTLRLRAKEIFELQNDLLQDESLILEELPDEWSYDLDNFIRAYKTARMIEDWINEKNHEYFLEKYKFPPGSLHSLNLNIDWILYAMEEIAKYLGKKEFRTELKKMRVRVKYGVREELLTLLKFKGIGRVRARKLFNRGIKTPSDIRRLSLEFLQNVVGVETAKKLKTQV